MGPHNENVSPHRLKDLVLSSNGHVFDTRTGRSYTLNLTAQAALLLLQDGHSPKEVIGTLAERCGQHVAVVEAGVESFLGQIGRYLS